MGDGGSCGGGPGVLWIGDPGYFIDDPDVPPENRQVFAHGWDGFFQAATSCGRVESKPFLFTDGNEGLGVLITSFGGDDLYPVQIRREMGVVVEARILFDSDGVA